MDSWFTIQHIKGSIWLYRIYGQTLLSSSFPLFSPFVLFSLFSSLSSLLSSPPSFLLCYYVTWVRFSSRAVVSPNKLVRFVALAIPPIPPMPPIPPLSLPPPPSMPPGTPPSASVRLSLSKFSSRQQRQPEQRGIDSLEAHLWMQQDVEVPQQKRRGFSKRPPCKKGREGEG